MSDTIFKKSDFYPKGVLISKLNNISGNITEILYADLYTLRSESKLTPNKYYRITDYTTTTVQADTQSAGHNFDIIVKALSTNELSENAKCVRKAGDTYFTNAKLEAWEIKYCIDNDTTRFAWVLNRIIVDDDAYERSKFNDETISEIDYYAWVDTGDPGAFHYTLSEHPKIGDSIYNSNGDLKGSVIGNIISGKGVIYYMKDEWGNECPYDFKNIQYSKNSVRVYTFGGAIDNSLSGGCHHNIINDYVLSSTLTLNFNTFGVNCYYNTFGYNCYSNTFGYKCYQNTFGNGCYSNTFDYSCRSNTFGYGCYSNTFDYSCYLNTFGNYCESNTFGNYCYSNTFGNGCMSNKFYHGSNGTIKKNYIRYIVLEDGVSYNNFYSALTTSGAFYLQRIRIKGLESTTTTNIQINTTTNNKFEWVICYTSGNVLKQYCPNDLTNNQTYKIEDTIVSTWVASTAYPGYGYQAQINIPNLTESDIVSVTFAGVDVISGNYYPTIQIYDGYILLFSKVNTEITIPTIEITKI